MNAWIESEVLAGIATFIAIGMGISFLLHLVDKVLVTPTVVRNAGLGRGVHLLTGCIGAGLPLLFHEC